MAYLLTGGLGYIGSHTAIELLNEGKKVVIVDNLSNCKIEMWDKIQEISGKKCKFYQDDILDYDAMDKIFTENNITQVIHFAGLKAVGESCEMPIEYYQNNVGGTIVLLEVMKKHNCKKIVFSSSSTVYGSPEIVPVKEDFPLSTTNPYGTTKLFIERILQDVEAADNEWSIVLLRYFNPIGAHESGLIGEDPNGVPNNIMPYITQVAIGKLDHLRIFGNDYDTPDGTGIRDYIHVVDLAQAHIKAAEKAEQEKGVFIYNLGTGRGHSVLELVKTFEDANGVKVKYEFAPRRPGDIAENYADCPKAKAELGWEAKKDLYQMCRDAWRYAKNCYEAEQKGSVSSTIDALKENFAKKKQKA